MRGYANPEFRVRFHRSRSVAVRTWTQRASVSARCHAETQTPPPPPHKPRNSQRENAGGPRFLTRWWRGAVANLPFRSRDLPISRSPLLAAGCVNRCNADSPGVVGGGVEGCGGEGAYAVTESKVHLCGNSGICGRVGASEILSINVKLGRGAATYTA